MLHCATCGDEVEIDVLLTAVPERVLCTKCHPTAEPAGEHAPEVEIVEAGNDGGVLGLDLTF